jgi:RNA polymerase Rpb8
MHGRIFGIKHIENQRVEIQASFGGLLMKIKGQQALVDSFAMDMMLVDLLSCFIYSRHMPA